MAFSQLPGPQMQHHQVTCLIRASHVRKEIKIQICKSRLFLSHSGLELGVKHVRFAFCLFVWLNTLQAYSSEAFHPSGEADQCKYLLSSVEKSD